jgi:hypothetical protein
LVLAKESKNIQVRNAELKWKRVKSTNVQFYCVWYLSTRVNVSRDTTNSASTSMFGEYSCKFLVQNSNWKESRFLCRGAYQHLNQWNAQELALKKLKYPQSPMC